MSSINPIYYHNQYDKLVDDILIFANNAVLRMNVILSNKGDDKTRYHYHSEFMYDSNKYIDTDKLITLRRSMKYYLSIENLKAPMGSEKEFIMIGVKDIINVRFKLDQVSKWFTSSEFSGLYAYSDSKLVLLGRVEPIVISGLPMNKKIVLEPTVLVYDNASYEGVRMYLNNQNNYIDIHVDSFMGLLYIINSINMYESAQLLLNYLGRPELGTNLVTFNDNNNYIEQNEKVEVKQNRKIPGSRKKSYFDKIDDL